MRVKYIDPPQTMQPRKYNVMLEDRVTRHLACTREGLKNRFLERKPHSGIQGTVEADH